MNNYQDFLAYLNKKEKFGIKFGLDNINYLLGQLGSPHKKLRFIHVAGTNGKGSVCAMLSSILNQVGIKTGLYTSPHLVEVRERIRLNEKDISESEILETAKKVIPLALPETTYFELLTAIAIEYFYEKGAEIAILETGMGGRLDATNACFGEIAIITDISLEHTQYLGTTIEQITHEKTAIIKPDSTAITAQSLDNDFAVYSRNLDYQTIKIGDYDNLKLNLLGDHQVRNCALAIKAIEALNKKGYNASKESIYTGLANVRWQGRFQIISKEPIIILDGAHNPGAAAALKDTVEKYLGQKVILIIGVLKDKDYTGMLNILKPIAERIIAVTPKSDRALSGKILMDAIKNKTVEFIPEIKKALGYAIKDNIPILIMGSLYLAGEILNIKRQYSNSPQPYVLSQKILIRS